MMSINLNNIAIFNINGADYDCIINGISKNYAVNLLQMLTWLGIDEYDKNEL